MWFVIVVVYIFVELVDVRENLEYFLFQFFRLLEFLVSSEYIECENEIFGGKFVWLYLMVFVFVVQNLGCRSGSFGGFVDDMFCEVRLQFVFEFLVVSMWGQIGGLFG